MRATYFVPKKINSVPFYDKDKETYSIFIDQELVVIPEKLFNKIFEKSELSDENLSYKDIDTENSLNTFLKSDLFKEFIKYFS